LIDGPPIVGTVARRIARKDVDVLLRAFSTVQHPYRAHLLVVGDGSKRDELRAFGRELGIDCTVSCVGQRSDTSILLRAMEVPALPSRLEGSRNAVPKAMATGLPIVATRIGGITDLLDERRTALPVAPDDIHALAMALAWLPCDVRLHADLGSRVTTRAVEDFSPSESMQRLINFYPALQNAS
jgi:glycosyltransferase involved in cell wall biosynthesis